MTPSVLRSSGTKPTPELMICLTRASDEFLAAELDGTAHVVHQAHDRLGQLGLAVALDARHGEDLALGDAEAHRVQQQLAGGGEHRQVGDLEGFLAELRLVLVQVQRDRTADHQGGEFGGRGARIGLADDLAAADHRDGVGDGLDLAQLVRDEDDGGAGVAQLPHDVEQFVGFLRGEHGGGLVKDQHLGVADQCLDDFHALLHAHGQVLDDRIGINAEPVAIGDLADAGAGLLEVQDAGRAGVLVAQGNVLGDREDGDEHEVLVHHADPGGHGIARAVELHWLVVDEDFALGGLVEAEENIHEGRFTGPVFTEQGMDLAGLDDDVDVVVGSEVAESFGDAPKLEFHVCYPFSFSSGPIGAGGCRVEVGPAVSTLVKTGLRRNAGRWAQPNAPF